MKNSASQVGSTVLNKIFCIFPMFNIELMVKSSIELILVYYYTPVLLMEWAAMKCGALCRTLHFWSKLPEERLMKFLSFLALVNSAAEDVKQVLSISNNLPLCAIVHTKGFFMENLIMINGKRNCQDAAEEEVAQK